LPIQLKKTYAVVDDLKQQSGFKWDELRGADIRPESQAVWDAYVVVSSQANCHYTILTAMKKNPKAAPFRQKGWAHYHAIHALLPTKPKGSNVFHPGQPVTQEENGEDDLPGGDVGDMSGGGTGEDAGHMNPSGSDDEEEEELIPWVSRVVGAIM
jgi:hypothetical protein